MWIQIYIGVFILIQKSASEAVSLPSPANVSIQCDSYGVEVRWEYPDLHQDIYFQVKLKSDLGERISNLTQNLRLNISNMLHDVAFNRFYVNVTAVRGGQKSNSTRSDYFGYNENSLIKIYCYLDFPEVKLSPKDGKLLVQFINPLQLYRNSPVLPNFNDLEYSIQTEEDKYKEICKRNRNTSCETSVKFSEPRGNYCINLTGRIGQSLFNPRSSCFTGDIRSYVPVTVYLYPVLGVLLTLLFITLIIILLVKRNNSEMKKKVHKMFRSYFEFNKKTPHQTETLDPKKEVVQDVRIDETEPYEEPEEQTTLIALTDDDSSGSSKSEDKSYGPNSLVEDEHSNQSDFYDCPHAPRQRQEMSPGDTVDGYGPKL